MNVSVQPQIPLFDLDLLRTLIAIAETGSFSAAAALVGRTPSAISMQVKKMEEITGRALFLRDSRSVSLTPDGGFLLGHARRMIAMNAEALAHFAAPQLRGVVRLGSIDDVAERFLPGLLRRFAESHPGIAVDVTVDGSVQMAKMYREQRLDIALLTYRGDFEGDDEAEAVYRERLVWAVCKGGVAARQTPLPVSVWEDGCFWRKVGLDGLDALGRPWRIAFESAHIAAQRAAIRADLAVAPLAVSSLGGDIVEASEDLGLPPLPHYSIAMMARLENDPVVAAAADHLRTGFAQAQ